MSEDLDVPEREHGRVRVFAVNMPPEEVQPLIDAWAQDEISAVSRPTAEAAQSLLGCDGLDTGEIELFPVKDLEGVGLTGYLADGHGVPMAQLAPDKTRLDALEGYVLLVLSAAFRSQPASIVPNATVTLVGTYGQPRTDWSSVPMESESAAPFSGAGPSPREIRAQAQRTGATVFAVVIGLITLLVAWLVFG